ncbi:MAG: hypothetical protein SXV54_03765 [Chloroflexota bacterium]|nr:hypothetical protein [Chloroflexota bacterium]
MVEKAKVIISDLHVGAGFASDNPLEDFISDDEFAALLNSIVAESNEKGMDVELILNGDIIEFLQVPAVDAFDPQAIYPPELYRPSSEVASAKKTLLVIRGHLTLFAALRNFINLTSPRRNITVLKGNHDVNLHWSTVQDFIRQAVGATGDRESLLAFEERLVSRESIYVEHGNQYAEKINHFDNFEEPLDPRHPGELETPPGSGFVLDFFNDVEREKWWVDAVKPITSLIWYGFAVDFAFAARVLLHFLRVAPILIVGSFAVEEGPGVRAQMQELRQQLEDEAEVVVLGERYATDTAFRSEFDARLGRILRAIDAMPEIALPSAIEAAEASKTLEQAQEIAKSSDTALRKVAQDKIKEGSQVVVFGHTHRALCEQLDGGTYLNSGTWVWWRDFAGTDLETWREFYAHPENFAQPHYLTYVRVDYDQDGRPHARLLDYTGQLVVECPSPSRCKFVVWLATLWEKLVGFFRPVKTTAALSGQ